ncbi:3-isopropylmalate dehydrogenase [Salipaludibacillus sp. HK11]|uniref:3-isopropylmalate dehydrogenase n=1 Tax=Salipaludibacillus sp. HK11 TaxID=3394320 RepID=UPI0039FCE958
MIIFFKILLVVFVVTANLIGFLVFKKSKNLYLAALAILVLAGVFGLITSIVVLSISKDAWAAISGLNLALFLFYNSMFVLLFAIVVSTIKKIKKFFQEPEQW